MKRIITGLLVLGICFSLFGCNSKQNHKETDSNHTVCIPAATEQSDNVIMFETPIVVAEDEYVRVELLKFYQEHYIWSDMGGAYGTPEKVTPSIEGSALESLVVFKFYNKCDHRVRLYMDNTYLGNDGASLYLMAAKVNPDAGKSVTAPYLIRTDELTPLQSMEELYSFEGEFLVQHEYEDGTKKNPHTLKFSIPAAVREVNKADSQNVESNSESNSKNTGGCEFKDLDGSICGADCTDYPSLCNYHFEMLNAFYQNMTNSQTPG